MPKLDSSAKRSALYGSYDKLKRVLEQRPKLCPDVEPLAKAASSINCYTEGGIEYLKHSVSRLILRFSALEGCFPESIVDLDCIINFNACSSFPKADSPLDPFDTLTIDFELSGSANHPKARKRVQYWHFDRNLEGKNSNTPVDAHPLYHFQFGGYKMRNHAVNHHRPAKAFGHLILLDAPRIAHPPLDAVLAFDFVLSNFAGSLRSKLLKEGREYLVLLSEHQERYWKPYHDVLACLWGPPQPVDSRWSGEKVWPQFIVQKSTLSPSLVLPSKPELSNKHPRAKR